MRILVFVMTVALLLLLAAFPAPGALPSDPGGWAFALGLLSVALSGIAFGLGVPALGAPLFAPALALAPFVAHVALYPVTLLGFAVLTLLVGGLTFTFRTVARGVRIGLGP